MAPVDADILEPRTDHKLNHKASEIRLADPSLHLSSLCFVWSLCPQTQKLIVKLPRFQQDEFSALTKLLHQSQGPDMEGVEP